MERVSLETVPWRHTRLRAPASVIRGLIEMSWVLAASAAICSLSACGSSPSEPGAPTLAVGRWTGDGACLSVTDAGCNLAVGCGHGQFPRPKLRSDGSFDVDGTYRIEAGPVSIQPAPPAHFSGVVSGSSVTLKVVPTADALLPASYSMTLTGTGTCPVPCV
jgi:hypothetical protein